MSESTLMERLRSSELLTPEQLAELERLPEAADPDPKVLGKIVHQRGWLTKFQISQTAVGKGKDLFIGPYLLLDRIGEGGMGQVFKARHRHLKRLVAIKVIRKEKLVKEDSVRRFYREIEAAGKLTHPNIVMAFDAGQAGAVHFFSMEYIEGTDLMRLVREKGPLPVAQACEFIRQAALGLQHAHERGMVHRDIKPSNLLVTTVEGKPVVKILDMGLARLDDAFTQERNMTREGQVLGTPDYLAPEQARDARKVDIRGDIYSLGCTLFFLLTRRAPFKAETLTEVLMKHQMEEATAVRSLRPDVPEALDRLLRRMMGKKPEERPSTPAEVAEALEPFTRGDKNYRVQSQVSVSVPFSPSIGEETAPSMSDDDRGAVAQWVRSKPDRTQNLAPEVESRKTSVVRGRKTEDTRKTEEVLEKSKAPVYIAAGVGAGLMLLMMLGGLTWMLWPAKNPPASITDPGKNGGNPVVIDNPGNNVVVNPAPPVVARGIAGEICTLKEVVQGARVRSVIISLDGKQSLTAYDTKILKHTLGTGELTQTVIIDSSAVLAMAATRDWGKVVLVTGNRRLFLWKEKTGQLTLIGKPLAIAPLGFALSPDGKYALVSAASYVMSTELRPDGTPSRDPIRGKDGKEVKDYAVHLWDLDGEKEVHQFGGAGKETPSLAFTSDGKYVVASSMDQTLRVWDLATKKPVQATRPLGATGSVKIATIGQNSHQVLLGTQNGRVLKWDCELGREISSFSGKHNAPITGLVVSDNGETAVSIARGSYKLVKGQQVPVDPTVRVWSVAKGAETAVVEFPDNPRAVAVSADGKSALVALNDGLHYIDLTKIQTK